MKRKTITNLLPQALNLQLVDPLDGHVYTRHMLPKETIVIPSERSGQDVEDKLVRGYIKVQTHSDAK